MVPSNMDLIIGNINGYNNLIVIASSDLQLGHNDEVNKEQPIAQETFESPPDDEFDSPVAPVATFKPDDEFDSPVAPVASFSNQMIFNLFTCRLHKLQNKLHRVNLHTRKTNFFLH